MYMSNFDYHRPSTIAEALELLNANDGAQVLAGGHSLLPGMKLRLNAPSALVDVGHIPELSGIKKEGAGLRIGAMTTHSEVVASETVQQVCPLLAETARQIGDLQVRNLGTIGGSLAHADPAADYPAAIVALNATIHVAGPNSTRQIAAADFFVDLFTTALETGELITSVTIPATAQGSGSAYLKHRHPASSYCVVGAAAVVTLDNGQCSDVSLVIGGATGLPVRVTAAEDALRDQAANEESIAAAVTQVTGAIQDPLSDPYASGEYRTHLAAVLARRALAKAIERGQS